MRPDNPLLAYLDMQSHPRDSNPVPLPRDPQGPDGDLTEWSCQTVQNLLRSLVQRPELESLLNYVNLDISYESNFLYEDAKRDAGGTGHEYTQLSIGLVEGMGLEDGGSWTNELY
ncbi:hypothetical protein BDV12DRAFT_192613 [Aspergillus spectabilis]